MTYEEICKYVFKEEGLDWSSSKSRKRDSSLRDARHIATYIGNSVYPALTWSELAKIFGKCHATAIHSVKVINNEYSNNKHLRSRVDTYMDYVRQVIKAESELAEVSKLTVHIDLINKNVSDMVARMRIIALSYCQLTNQKIVPNENQD